MTPSPMKCPVCGHALGTPPSPCGRCHAPLSLTLWVGPSGADAPQHADVLLQSGLRIHTSVRAELVAALGRDRIRVGLGQAPEALMEAVVALLAQGVPAELAPRMLEPAHTAPPPRPAASVPPPPPPDPLAGDLDLASPAPPPAPRRAVSAAPRLPAPVRAGAPARLGGGPSPFGRPAAPRLPASAPQWPEALEALKERGEDALAWADERRGLVGGALAVLVAVVGVAVWQGDTLVEAEVTPAALRPFDPEVVLKSVFRVEVGDTVGTAFVLGERGILVTNAHVIGDAYIGASVTLRSDATCTAVVRAVDDDLDLAVLQADRVTECGVRDPLPFASGAKMKPGQTVYAVGSPVGLDLSVSRGIISSGGRRIGLAAFLQTDLAVNPGNSGGPLLDEYGRVVGVVTAKLIHAEGIGFALPVEYLGEGLHPALVRAVRQPDWLDGRSPALATMIAKAQVLAENAPPRPRPNRTPPVAPPPPTLPPPPPPAIRPLPPGESSPRQVRVVRAYADKEAMEVLFELVLPADDGWSPASVRALAEVKGVASFSRDLGMLVPISVSREGETAPTVHTFRAAFDTEGRDGVFRSVVVVTVYGVNPSPPAGINVAEEGSVNLPGPIKTRGAR